MNNPVFSKNILSVNQHISQASGKKGISPLGVMAPVYTIPVVVHVINKGEGVGIGTNISDAQIQSGITSLSQYFRGQLGFNQDAEIQFQLATLDPSCNATNGIDRINGTGVPSYNANGLVTGGGGNELAVKALSNWPNTNYYNIWVVSEIDNNGGGAGTQGFAYFPGAPSDRDGMVILYNAFGYDPTGTLGYNLKGYTNQNKTATHEMGHALGLYHTFQGDDANNDGVADQCPANADCTADGDVVCDTDPQQRSVSNCPGGTNGCSGNPFSNIVTNYMDYSSETCRDRFTVGQIARMRAAITSVFRASLVNSLALNGSYPLSPYTPPVAASCTPVTGPGMSADAAGIIQVSVNGRDFPSSTPSQDGGYVNGTSSCLNLIQLVRGATYSFSFTVYGANVEQLRAWIDYNNNGSFDNATEQLYFNSSVPADPSDFVTVSSNFTVPGTAVVNNPLRLRVMDDAATIYGIPAISSACVNPQFGQAEDYTVYLSSALPVTLEYFTGIKNDKDVILNWKTSMEVNALEFQVERSTNGDVFEKIGTVYAGNTARGGTYSYTDRNIAGNINVYRLRQVDIDHKEQLSQVVVIRSGDNIAPQLQVLNNPVGEKLQVVFNQVFDKNATVSLFDITGKKVFEQHLAVQDGQTNSIDLSPATLKPGVYVLRAAAGGVILTKKIIKK